MKLRSHTFMNRRWRVRRKHVKGQLGSCDPPDEPEKVIYLDPDLRGLEALRTAIHEGWHACDWHRDEEMVDQGSDDVGLFLWRLGYRNINELEGKT